VGIPWADMAIAMAMAIAIAIAMAMAMAMVEAGIDLIPLQTSILDIYKVFEPLVCCLKGVWLHSYTITLANLAPNLGIHIHWRSGNDATKSCLRQMSTSDCFIHPY
jgi:hypothetical protein